MMANCQFYWVLTVTFFLFFTRSNARCLLWTTSTITPLDIGLEIGDIWTNSDAFVWLGAWLWSLNTSPITLRFWLRRMDDTGNNLVHSAVEIVRFALNTAWRSWSMLARWPWRSTSWTEVMASASSNTSSCVRRLEFVSWGDNQNSSCKNHH